MTGLPNEAEDARVIRAAEGDGDALEALLREVGPSVAARLSINDRWSASLDREDVMQVSYLEAWMRIVTLKARTIGGFRAWLMRIAAHNLRDAVRALQSEKRPDGAARRVTRSAQTSAETLLERIFDEEPTAGTLAASSDAADQLRVALDELPDSYRQVVQRVDLDERSVSEVAVEMSRSTGAVHMLRARAHKRLREILGGRARFLGDSA